jgi:hypothetical protein
MLQIQLEIDSSYFHTEYKANRIDVIATSVKEAIQLASQFDPDFSVIMPEYMMPIELAEVSGEHFKLNNGCMGKHGDIFRSSRTEGELSYLCRADTQLNTELTKSQSENLDDLAIYMEDENE